LLAAIFAIEVVWTACVIFVAYQLGYLPEGVESASQENEPASNFMADLQKEPLLVIVMLLLVSSLWEEVVFRFIPLVAGMVVFQWSRFTRPLILLIALVASVLFGLIHVYSHETIGPREVLFTLLFQGVGGMGYSIIFLKYCGMRFVYAFGALATTTLMHTLWNLSLVGIVALALRAA
jgi:membrane protease YdiL (CAAX protease family)